MHNKHVFEYAVIRLVPKVEREEFLNIGVILFCAKLKFIRVKFAIHDERIKAFAPQLDLSEIQQHIHSFTQIAHGEKESGAIGNLDIASRFRWLTAIRSTVIQTSRIHPGLCTDDIDVTFNQLFEQFITV